MAIESIYFGVFSTQSDVWSYGVVLWELFTLGKTPYPGMEADDRFYKMLSEGYRMEKPPLAPSSIYDLMTECWAHEPSVRPTFSALVDRIGDLMEEGHRQQYVDLNVPYDKMNRECFSGKEDYLSKMSGPEFISVSARPTPERQYENVPQNLDSGYLIPISPSQPPNNTSNHLSPPPTEYQNVITPPQQEPKGHILANNAGYVFMSRPSPEGSTSYVKFDYEPEKIIRSQTSSPPLPPPQQSGTNNAAREMPGISNLSYVPNNMFFPNKTLEEGDEEEEEEEPGKIFLGNSTTDHHNNEQAKHPRRLRRHKNDSGLGSIDSSHFDSRSPVDPHRESNGSAEEYEIPAKDYGCQHNVAYVSVGLPKPNGTTHNNIVMHNGNNGVIV
jgi:serine/threonine protein kinase